MAAVLQVAPPETASFEVKLVQLTGLPLTLLLMWTSCEVLGLRQLKQGWQEVVRVCLMTSAGQRSPWLDLRVMALSGESLELSLTREGWWTTVRVCLMTSGGQRLALPGPRGPVDPHQSLALTLLSWVGLPQMRVLQVMLVRLRLPGGQRLAVHCLKNPEQLGLGLMVL